MVLLYCVGPRLRLFRQLSGLRHGPAKDKIAGASPCVVRKRGTVFRDHTNLLGKVAWSRCRSVPTRPIRRRSKHLGFVGSIYAKVPQGYGSHTIG